MRTHEFRSNNEDEKKIVIIDNYPLIREGLSCIIDQEKNLRVCCATDNITEALQAIIDYKADLIIVDFSPGSCCGLTFIENLNCSYDPLRILVFSAYDESIYAERCLKSGAHGYIMKHKTQEKILYAIQKVLNGDIYIDEILADRYINKFIAGKATNIGTSLDRLGNRELEVYLLLGQGLKRDRIAEHLNLSKRTVENHIERIKKKLEFSNTHELHMSAIRDHIESIK